MFHWIFFSLFSPPLRLCAKPCADYVKTSRVPQYLYPPNKQRIHNCPIGWFVPFVFHLIRFHSICAESNSLHLCRGGIFSSARPICIHLFGVGNTWEWIFLQISVLHRPLVWSVLCFSFSSAVPKERHSGLPQSEFFNMYTLCEQWSDLLKDLQRDDLLLCYATRVPLWHCYLAVI